MAAFLGQNSEVYPWTADPTGASFMLSLRPTAAPHQLKDLSMALGLGDEGFTFGGAWLGDSTIDPISGSHGLLALVDMAIGGCLTCGKGRSEVEHLRRRSGCGPAAQCP
jgi:hypothetical protein